MTVLLALGWIGLVIAVAGTVASILLTKNVRDRRHPGVGYVPPENPTDPTRVIGLGYGRPPFVPTVLSDSLVPSTLNTQDPDPKPSRRMILSLGAGEIDGGDVDIWIGDLLANKRVGSGSPESERTLDPVGTTRRRWTFRAGNIVPDSVEFFLDGTFYATGGGVGGETASTLDEEAVTATAKPFGIHWPSTKKAVAFRDGWGVFPPIPGIVAEDTVRLFATLKWPSGEIQKRELKHEVRWLDNDESDPKKKLWAIWIAANAKTLKGASFITLEARYRVKRFLNVPRFHTRNDGTVVVTFERPVAAGKLTATFRRSVFGGGLTWKIHKGERNSEPINDGNGARLSVPINEKLTQASPVVVTTEEAVDDIQVVLASGPQGFYTVSKSGSTREAHRHVRLKLRRVGAPDTPATSADPLTGWVTLSPTDGSGEFEIDGSTSGQANWFFGLADLLAWTRDGKKSKGNKLAIGQYEVSVTALDDEGLDPAGNQDPNAVDEVFLLALTNITSLRLTVPRHAKLELESDDPDFIARRDSVKVAIRERRAWVPATTAVYDPTTGRPEPGELKWTRNPALCAIDAILDPDFGAGERWNWSHVVLPDLLEAAAFCDSDVETPTGEMEKRAEFDGFLQVQQPGVATAVEILRGSGVMISISGGKIRVVADKQRPVAMEIGPDDYADADVKLRHPSTEAIPNQITYTYTPTETDGERISPTRRRKGSERERTVPLRMDLSGTRRDTQAARIVDQALAQAHLNRIAAEIIAGGWRLLRLEATDVIAWTDPDYGFTGKRFLATLTGNGSDLRPRLKLTEENVSAFSPGWGLPISLLPPGHRAPPPAQTGDQQITLADIVNGDVISNEVRAVRLKQIKVTLAQGSRQFRVDVGAFPTGIRGYRLFQKRITGPGSWRRVGEFYAPSSVVSGRDVFPEDDFFCRAFPLDIDGRVVGAHVEARVVLRLLKTDNRPIDPILDPDPLTQNGPVLTTGNPLQPSLDETEFDVEYRIGPDGGDPEDAVEVTKQPASAIAATYTIPNAITQAIHMRPIRRDTEEAGPWTSVDQKLAVPDLGGVEGFGNDFSGGTIMPLAGNVAPAVVSGSPETLERAPIYIDDLTATEIWDADDVEIVDAGLYWAPVRFKTPLIDVGRAEDVMLQAHPEVDLVASPRVDIEIWDAHWDIVSQPYSESGEPRDQHRDELDHTCDGDEAPVRFDLDVATSDQAAPVFTDVDFARYRAGAALPNVRTVQAIWTLWHRFDRQIVLKHLWLWWWVYCLSRPWCRFAEAGEIVHASALTATQNNIDIALPDAEAYAYIDVTVDWTGVATANKLRLYFNATPAAFVTLTGAGWNIGTKSERLQFRIIPKSGRERLVIVNTRAFYDLAGLVTNTTEDQTLVWADVLTKITSIHLTTDIANGLAAGTEVRVSVKPGV